MSACAIEKDRILFDYVVNYVFPQYSLPWNNFYTNIDAETFYQRNEERNQNARLARSPLVVTANPHLVIKNSGSIVDWRKTIDPSGDYSNTGSVVDSIAQKMFLGKLVSNGCVGFDYQYIYNGRFAGANLNNTQNCSWVILQFNLTQLPRSSNASVVVVSSNGPNPSAYSTLNGFIIINDERQVNIKMPLPLGLDGNNNVTDACNNNVSNTVYGLYGNRIFIAIKVDDLGDDSSADISYNISFRIAETGGLGSAIPGLALAAVGPIVG